MSSTGRGSERRQDDAYMTPGWAVRRLLDEWTPPSGVLVEPACGDGAIIRQIRGSQYHWISYDIREVQPVAEVHRQCNYLTVATLGPTVKAVITNPPYCLAEEFIRKSRSLYPAAQLVFLLRIAFLASETRQRFRRDMGIPDLYVLPNRPDFSGGGGDSADYAWFVWPACSPHAFGSLRVLALTPLEERRADKPRKP